MRTEQLTFTRFIAAISVVFFHHHRANAFFENANIFVSYFFILSGFVLAVSQKQQFSDKKEYALFYINRLARIYPAYLTSNLLYAIIINTLGWGLILNLLGIQAFLPNSALNYNYPSWSVSVELFFYACFPVLVHLFYTRYTLKTIIVSSLGFWLLTQVLLNALYHNEMFTQFDLGISFLLYNPINHLNEFIIGSVAGLVFKKRNFQWQANYDWIIIVFSLSIFGYTAYLRPSINLFDHNGFLMVLFIPFIFLLSLNTGYITQLFRQRPFIVAGEISFCLYIFAEPVFLVLIRLSKLFSLPLLSNFYFSLSALIGISCFLHYFLERPLQKIIKHKASLILDKKPGKNKMEVVSGKRTKKNVLLPQE